MPSRRLRKKPRRSRLRLRWRKFWVPWAALKGQDAPTGPGGQFVQAAIEAAGVEVSAIAGGHGGAIDYEAFQSAADISVENGRFIDIGKGLTRYQEAEKVEP